MSQESYWDPEKKLLRSQDPDKMTPQQKANWVLLQYVMDAEYRRGYEKGLEIGKKGVDIPDPVL